MSAPASFSRGRYSPSEWRRSAAHGAHLRESREMAFDAHGRAFAVFKGACSAIYDNMKTSGEAIFVGKGQAYGVFM